jgi:hypothetical protein
VRWIEGYERIAEIAPDLPDTRLVYVADREADLMPLMARDQELGTSADWLVSAKHNRCQTDGDKLWGHTNDGPQVKELGIDLSKIETPGRLCTVAIYNKWLRFL